MAEYLLCDNIETAHECVRSILSNPDFKELLVEDEKREVTPSIRLCYNMMKHEKEDGLVKLIKAFL